tara:strand:- start:4572 stop:5411 length:840 start_codon:yes stop_codon:yes gene_type:complete
MVRDPERFYFDGQIHIPVERLEETLIAAIDNGLDAIIPTDYDGLPVFTALAKNKYEDGSQLLDERQWKTEWKDLDYCIEVTKEDKTIYVFKGQEIKTMDGEREGHLLAWCIDEALPTGMPLIKNFQFIYDQNGIPVFAHPFVSLFHGCGEQGFNEWHKEFGQMEDFYPLGLDVNGQIAPIWEKFFHSNQKVEELGENHNIPVFGTSDAHGAYGKEYLKVGRRYHTSVPKNLINPDDFRGSLQYIMENHPDEIAVHGDTNTLRETVSWNLRSKMKRFRIK